MATNHHKTFVPPPLPAFEELEIDKDWQIHVCRCQRCGYKWIPEQKKQGSETCKPKVCARCRSVYWDTQRALKKDENKWKRRKVEEPK